MERHRYEVSWNPNHLRRYRNVELGLGSYFQVLLLASLLQSSAGSKLRQPRGSRRDVECYDLLAGTRSRWFPAGCYPLPDRAGGDVLREPAGDPRGGSGTAQESRRSISGRDAAGGGEPVAGRSSSVLWRRG